MRELLLQRLYDSRIKEQRCLDETHMCEMKQRVKVPSRISPDAGIFLVEVFVVEDRSIEDELVRPLVRWRPHQPDGVVWHNVQPAGGAVVLASKH